MNSKKKILSDSVWSVAGLVLMNVALQFAVYPFWERRAGEGHCAASRAASPLWYRSGVSD